MNEKVKQNENESFNDIEALKLYQELLTGPRPENEYSSRPANSLDPETFNNDGRALSKYEQLLETPCSSKIDLTKYALAHAEDIRNTSFLSHDVTLPLQGKKNYTDKDWLPCTCFLLVVRVLIVFYC